MRITNNTSCDPAELWTGSCSVLTQRRAAFKAPVTDSD